MLYFSSYIFFWLFLDPVFFRDWLNDNVSLSSSLEIFHSYWWRGQCKINKYAYSRRQWYEDRCLGGCLVISDRCLGGCQVLIVIIKSGIIDGVVKLFLSSGHKRPLLMRYCSLEDTENVFNMQTRSTYFKLFSPRSQGELLFRPAQHS